MAREMLLAGVDPEELKKSETAAAPRTFGERWQNYWYHHKWSTIAGIFVLAVVLLFTAQMLSRNDPDYTILVATADHDVYTLVPLENMLERYGDDLDGDGEVEVRLVACHLGASEYTTVQDQTMNFQILQTHLVSGDVMLFAFEKEYFGWFMGEMSQSGQGFLTPLGVTGAGVSEDGLYWNWNKDPRVTDDPQLKTLPQEMCFGVRVATGTASGRETEQQQCLALLRRVIANQPTH
ncbi:MAG: hypothetical protein E7541_07350 [Ruminococcaceae bacterium]|nr:hypothetical protein [Oscillospiraceae bacterium]